MILRPESFTGIFDVGLTDHNRWVADNLAASIAEYEPQYCRAVIGSALYGELAEASGAGTATEEQAALIDRLTPLILRYVYVHYLSDQRYAVAGGTVVIPAAAESNAVPPFDVQRVRWNEMADKTRHLICWLRENGETYPGWEFDRQLFCEYGLNSRMSILGIWV
jgi:hypothetical protein